MVLTPLAAPFGSPLSPTSRSGSLPRHWGWEEAPAALAVEATPHALSSPIWPGTGSPQWGGCDMRIQGGTFKGRTFRGKQDLLVQGRESSQVQRFIRPASPDRGWGPCNSCPV